MQSTRMICFACRRRLLATTLCRAQAPGLPQCQLPVKAQMSSASPGTPAPAPDNINDDYIPSIDATVPQDPQAQGRDASGQSDGASTQRFKGLDRRKAIRRHQDGGRENSLEIFERVVRQQVDQQELAPTLASKTTRALEYYNDLAQLRPMMRSESLEVCLDFFLTRIWPNVPFNGRSHLLQQRGTYLVTKVAQAKWKDWDNEKLPSLARIIELFHELDSLSCKKLSDSIMGLVRNIVTRSTAEEDYPTAAAYEKSLARKELLLQDLVDSWIVFHRQQLTPRRPGDIVQRTWPFKFSEDDEKCLHKCAEDRNLVGAFRMIFPRIHGNEGRVVVPPAIASFVLLADPFHSTLEIQQKAKPLLEPIAKILTAIPIWKPGLEKLFEGHTEVSDFVLKHWDSLTSQLRQTERPRPRPRPSAAASNPGTQQLAGPISLQIQRKLTTALKMGDIDSAEAAWAHFWGPTAIPDDGQKEQLRMMPELFHYFITAFTALHRPQRSVDVWDSMTSIGMLPTVKTWTALIEGCRRSKNAAGIENIWKKLLASGLELDDRAWASRVVGLIDCGEPEAGLRALREMPRKSRLSITPVNAAVAALIRRNAMSAAKNVLSWASENNVEPDIITYNTLLGPLVKEGSAKQVENLLNMMRNQGVQPDTATFTVLLEGLSGSFNSADPADQLSTVGEFFRQMDASGVQANLATFAKMLHLLLSEPNANTYKAVEAILAYMKANKVQTSIEIFTILVEHYLSLDPPNLAAADQLLNATDLHWRTINWGGLDRVFWERVIKGYAAAGEVDKAFDIFQRVNNVGTALTLDMLDTLLKSLVKAGRMEEAKKTVEIVKRDRAKSAAKRGGDAQSFSSENTKVRGRYWRHGFWAYAVDCGLISADELRRLELGSLGGSGSVNYA